MTVDFATPYARLAVAGAIGLATIGAVVWHQTSAHNAIAAAEKRGADAAYARVEAKARAIETAANELNRKISTTIRNRTDAENNRTRDLATDLLVRGPGAAAVPRCPATAGTAGGPDAAGRASAPAGASVPQDERAAVPWGWLVSHAQTCDLNRNEVIAWRDFYAQLRASWPKSSTPKEK